MSPDGCKTSLSHCSGMSPWSGEEIRTMASLFCNYNSGAKEWTQSVGMAELELINISTNWAFSFQLDHFPEDEESQAVLASLITELLVFKLAIGTHLFTEPKENHE